MFTRNPHTASETSMYGVLALSVCEQCGHSVYTGVLVVGGS